MSDKKNEAMSPEMKKMMQQHARDASAKSAMAPSRLPNPATKLQKKNPAEFDPKSYDPVPGEKPSGLKLAHETGTANLAGFQAPISDEDKMTMVRELIRQRMKEVVRKKPGGGGWVLYIPNPGKKKGSKAVGNFPTKLGAKRAQLARFPPKDAGKLKRLRKEIDRMAKDPKKAQEKDREAARAKKVKRSARADVKKEAVVNETIPGGIRKDVNGFMSGLKTLPKTGPQRGQYVTAHMSDPAFLQSVQKHPQGKQIMQSLIGFANKGNATKTAGVQTTTAGKPSVGAGVTRPGDTFSASDLGESMHRKILSVAIKKSLVESLFREEKTDSEWDDYISRLSKNALAGDSKFQRLQSSISKKTEGMLQSAFDTIRKAIGKSAKVKSYGLKKDQDSGKSYLVFGASFDNVSVEPFYIHIEGGVPKIEVSSNAKTALTKVDPGEAKLFRAELVTVQERVLDEMDELSRAIQTRDKYLQKLENGVDEKVAEMSPLEISLLKQLLVKKYRKNV